MARSARRTGRAALGLLLLGSLLAATARLSWVGEVAANFRWQLGVAGLAAPALLLAGRSPRCAVLAAALALAHLLPALALSLPPESAAPGAPEVRVATANLYFRNRDPAAVTSWLARERYDVVALQEVTRAWRLALQRELSAVYPYQVYSPLPEDAEPDDFGLGLLSRHPLGTWSIRHGPDPERPHLDCRLDVGGHELQVVVVHPMRPGGPDLNQARDLTLHHVAETVPWTDTAVVLGDLNSTTYSPAFADFVHTAGLSDTRAGFGRLPTWRSNRWVHGLWLDLDHILVRPGLGVLVRGVGPDIGSDHRPATATLCFRADAERR